jgi:hypothetical protein
MLTDRFQRGGVLPPQVSVARVHGVFVAAGTAANAEEFWDSLEAGQKAAVAWIHDVRTGEFPQGRGRVHLERLLARCAPLLTEDAPLQEPRGDQVYCLPIPQRSARSLTGRTAAVAPLADLLGERLGTGYRFVLRDTETGGGWDDAVDAFRNITPGSGACAIEIRARAFAYLTELTGILRTDETDDTSVPPIVGYLAHLADNAETKEARAGAAEAVIDYSRALQHAATRAHVSRLAAQSRDARTERVRLREASRSDRAQLRERTERARLREETERARLREETERARLREETERTRLREETERARLRQVTERLRILQARGLDGVGTGGAVADTDSEDPAAVANTLGVAGDPVAAVASPTVLKLRQRFAAALQDILKQQAIAVLAGDDRKAQQLQELADRFIALEHLLVPGSEDESAAERAIRLLLVSPPDEEHR